MAELRKGTDVAAALHPAMRDIHFVDSEDPDECVNAYYPDPAPVYPPLPGLPSARMPRCVLNYIRPPPYIFGGTPAPLGGRAPCLSGGRGRGFSLV